ncbi:MAG: hypothetical protein GY896_11710 [Gammaproteobacteria bacterium]|nr:hypothetical protein [Gammaproteobacteria bacterium]
MQLLAETLTADDTSQSFLNESRGLVYIEILGTFDSNNLTMQVSKDDTTFTDFTCDGTAQVFTAPDTVSYDLPKGRYYRFDVENTGTVDIDIYVDGHQVEDL